MKKKLIAMFLLCSCAVSLCFGGCGQHVTSDIPVTEEPPVTAEPYEPEWLISPTQNDADQTVTDAYLTLSANLARMNYQQNKNMLVSPASIEFALGMALAGAEGETLAQMNRVLGNTASREEILDFCQSYQEQLADGKDSPFKVANSIWVNEKVITGSLKKSYTSTLDEVFHAESYREPFTDATKDKINKWCSKNTDKMIPEILKKMNPASAAFLINAICFDANWAEPYEEYQVEEDVFHNEDGTESTVDFMHEDMNTYYEIDNACGFCKYYEDYDYAFLAILPDKNVGLEQFLGDFDADTYRDFMASETGEYLVSTQLPKFSSDYSVNANDQLKALGITDAFVNGLADFSGIIDKSENNLFIDNIIHKTHVEVNENGTKAAAVTMIEMRDAACAPMDEPEWREVHLDRPFLYMIIDTETEMPVFIGTVNQF